MTLQVLELTVIDSSVLCLSPCLMKTTSNPQHISSFALVLMRRSSVFTSSVKAVTRCSKAVSISCVGGSRELLTNVPVGVAIKMGATKEDFDACVAIRTSAIDNATHCSC